MPEETIYRRAEAWLFDKAVPAWLEGGLDLVHGGFVEALAHDGRDAALAFKRTRVTCRQIYVFAHAQSLGAQGTAPAIDHGLDFLLGRAWLGDDKGFARTVTRSGLVLDQTTDLYDHAFVLFALAWAHRATGRPDLPGWAIRTLDVIEKVLKRPDGCGFWSDSSRTGWLAQNPHMHMLEASLACLEQFGGDRFATLAHELVGLFRTRFIDHETGTLCEHFSADWSPAPDEPGRIVEPGHQMEWVWILGKCSALLGEDLAAEQALLFASAEAHGLDPVTKAVRNKVRNDGDILDGGSRTWPNCERIKCAVALHEGRARDPLPDFESAAGLLLGRYLAHPLPGLWFDHFDETGTPVAPDVPASTFYHLFFALAEMLRIGEETGNYQPERARAALVR